jgi:hypothetical protein
VQREVVIVESRLVLPDPNSRSFVVSYSLGRQKARTKPVSFVEQEVVVRK